MNFLFDRCVAVHLARMLTIWPKIVEAVERVSEPMAFEVSPAARKVDRLRETRKL